MAPNEGVESCAEHHVLAVPGEVEAVFGVAAAQGVGAQHAGQQSSPELCSHLLGHVGPSLACEEKGEGVVEHAGWRAELPVQTAGDSRNDGRVAWGVHFHALNLRRVLIVSLDATRFRVDRDGDAPFGGGPTLCMPTDRLAR